MAYSRPAADFVTSQLGATLNAGDTTGTIGTGLNIPATNGVLQIDYDSAALVGALGGPEVISYATYTTGSGALGGVVRGLAGTTDVKHNNLASVQAGPSSLYFSAAQMPLSELQAEAWATWAPTFANFTKDTSTIVAKYIQIGKTVHYRLSVILAGASVAMGTSPTFTLPVTSVDYVTADAFVIGHARILDANSTDYNGYALWTTTTTATILSDNGTGGAAGITSTAPFTWAATDGFHIVGTYEAA